MNFVRDYISELESALHQLPDELVMDVVDLLHTARLEERNIFVMGNGGSASTATHLVCDLAKNTRTSALPHFRVIGLSDNMAILSALANDEGYENVFSQQLANLVRPGDIVIAISASGNSPNVVNAVKLALERGARTIGMTGFDGGRVGKMVNINLHVPTNHIEHVEDAHLILEHMICRNLREKGMRLVEDLAATVPADMAEAAAD